MPGNLSSAKGLPGGDFLGHLVLGLSALGPAITRRHVARGCQADLGLGPSFLPFQPETGPFLHPSGGERTPPFRELGDFAVAWGCAGPVEAGPLTLYSQGLLIRDLGVGKCHHRQHPASEQSGG